MLPETFHTHKFPNVHGTMASECTECGLKTDVHKVEGDMKRVYFTVGRWKTELHYSCEYLKTFPDMISEDDSVSSK